MAKIIYKEGGIAMKDKIGEIVTLPHYDTEARGAEAPTDECEGCYYNYLCENYISNGALGFCTCNARRVART